MIESVEALQAELQIERERSRSAEARLVACAKNAVLGEIVTLIPHDILNLMTPVVGYTDLLGMHSGLPDECKTYVQRIRDASRKTVELLRGLAIFKDIQPCPAGVDPRAAILLAISVLEYNLHRKKVNIVREFADSLPRVIAGSGELEMLIAALLINAKIAMLPAGGAVCIRASHEFGAVRISVSDQGPGLATVSGAENDGNSGLYLFLCRQILESHGSALEIETRAGTGTTFSFELKCFA